VVAAPDSTGPPRAFRSLARATLAVIVSRGLPGIGASEIRDGGRLPDEPLQQADWGDLLVRADTDHLTAPLWMAIDEGWLPVTAEQHDEARRAHLDALCGDLVRERALLDVAAVLARAGLDHRVLKGSAVAHLDYGDPALRSFGDVDLLVRSSEWEAAVSALRASGWRREFDEPRPGFDSRFTKGAVMHSDDCGVELDLHRTLSLGPFGLTVKLQDLWDGHARFEVGGATLHALAAEERFLHACLHSVLGDYPPRIAALRDVAQMGLVESLDLAGAATKAASWRAEAVVARAVGEAWRRFGLDPTLELAVWARTLSRPRAQMRTLKLYTQRERSYAAMCLAALRVVPGVTDKARYAAALAVPDRRFLSARHGGHLRRLRTAGESIVGSRRSRRPD
jgi:Uncharacterised nucleotidyltransferase